MDKATLTLLEDSDHPTECERPPGFDYKKSMHRAEALVPKLEKIVGRSLSIDQNVAKARTEQYRRAEHRGKLPWCFVASGFRGR